MSLLHPPLAHCRRLFLRQYEIHIYIGAYASEKKGEQRVLVDVDLYVPLACSTPAHDQLSEVVNYDFMRATIAQRVAQGHIHLQETLCDDVARALLAHPAVQAVRIATAKPDAYSDCEAVGVEVFCIKPQSICHL